MKEFTTVRLILLNGDVMFFSSSSIIWSWIASYFVWSKIGKAMRKNAMFVLLMFSKEKPQECFVYSIL